MSSPAVNFLRGGAAPRIYGLTDWDTTNVLATANTAGLIGATTGYWSRALWWVISQSGAAGRILTCANSDANGHALTTAGVNNGSYRGFGLFTGPVQVQTPAVTITADMVLKLIDAVLVWDQPAGLLRLYHQGVEVGSQATALAALPSNGRTAFGCRTSSLAVPLNNAAVHGGEGGESIPTAGEILAAHNATRAAVAAGQPALGGIAGKTTWRCQLGTTWDPPTSITAEVGGNMTMAVGAASGLTLVSLTAPAWAA